MTPGGRCLRLRCLRLAATAVFLTALTVAIDVASACQPAPAETTGKLFAEATVVIRARVQKATDVRTGERENICRTADCNLMRLDLQVGQTFKAPGGGTPAFYVLAQLECPLRIVAGSDYVLFLRAVDRTGDALVTEAGHMHRLADGDTPRNAKLIAELKRLALRASVRGRCRACSSERREK